MMTLEALDVQHRYADLDGLTMHYVTRGEGPAVVLLHGFPEMWWSWRHQIEPLARAGFRVIVPDLRGYNETDKHGPYDIETLTGDVKNLLDSLGISQATVISHDWGGALGWHLAATSPDRVSRLVVMNCPHPAMMQRALRTSAAQRKRSWYMLYFQLPWLPERALRAKQGARLRSLYRAHAKSLENFSDSELQPIVDNVMRPGSASAMLGWYRAAVRDALRGRATRLPTIDAPTLLIWARDDKALGYEDLVPGTERFVRNLRVEAVSECGHFVQSERPEQVNALLLEFLHTTIS
ncbi:MAG: alpha/beta hydrolase [Deltaproteobacteria bacterium]|nr:alpha/beta hydrolase [Deltaproteobacteria bacterium]